MRILRKISQQHWLPAIAGRGRRHRARFMVRLREHPKHLVSTSTGYQDIVVQWRREGRMPPWVSCVDLTVSAPCPVLDRSLPTGARKSQRPGGATGRERTPPPP